MENQLTVENRILLTELSDGLRFGYPDESIQNLKLGIKSDKKYFPAEFSYDDKGSVYFDRFVETKEYYLPQKEIEILKKYKDSIREITGNCDIYEVGAGSSKKSKILLESYNRKFDKVNFYPIDINAAIMIEGAKKYISELKNVHVNCIAGAYSDVFVNRITHNNTQSLFLLIGSSISQESDDNLLRDIRGQLDKGGFLLLSYDLQKDPEILRKAYLNYEASMCSLNVLDHLNDVFGTEFKKDNFEFDVLYNPEHKGCETHLRSRIDQEHTFEKLGVTLSLAKGESVCTGVQRKFNSNDMRKRLKGVGFEQVESFTDADGWYATVLFRAI